MDNTFINKTGEMLYLCVTAHHNQFDKGGNPYAWHPIAVRNIALSILGCAGSPEDREAVECIALGHDLIEDTGITYEYLKDRFGYRIARGIQILSKDKNTSNDDYIDGIILNTDALIVKMADYRHNSDIIRLKGVRPKDMKRMEKYARNYRTLEAAFREEAPYYYGCY